MHHQAARRQQRRRGRHAEQHRRALVPGQRGQPVVVAVLARGRTRQAGELRWRPDPAARRSPRRCTAPARRRPRRPATTPARGRSPTKHRRRPPDSPPARPRRPPTRRGPIAVGSSAAGARPVGAWASMLSLATSAAPAATFSAASGVVTTGARSRSDSRWVTSGMAAPPPTVATAATSAAANPLRCNVSSIAPISPPSGAAISFSSSGRVTRTSELIAGQFGRHHGGGLGRQPFLGLAALVAQAGPASRPRRCPPGRRSLASAMPASTWSSRSLVDLRHRRTRGSAPSRRSASRLAPASASVMLVPLPPRSTSATTPLSGRPGAACSAASAADGVGDQRRRARRRATGSAWSAALRAARRPSPGPQCAGTAIATGEPPSTVRAIASSASTSTLRPRCADPSAATSGTGSPTRSTKPLSTSPGCWPVGDLRRVRRLRVPGPGTRSAWIGGSPAGGRRGPPPDWSSRSTTPGVRSCSASLLLWAAHHLSGR